MKSCDVFHPELRIGDRITWMCGEYLRVGRVIGLTHRKALLTDMNHPNVVEGGKLWIHRRNIRTITPLADKPKTDAGGEWS